MGRTGESDERVNVRASDCVSVGLSVWVLGVLSAVCSLPGAKDGRRTSECVVLVDVDVGQRFNLRPGGRFTRRVQLDIERSSLVCIGFFLAIFYDTPPYLGACD